MAGDDENEGLLEEKLLEDKLIEFYNEYYPDRLSELYVGYPRLRSADLDIKNLEKFDTELANELIENPDTVMPRADAALAKLNPHPDAKHPVHARFFGLDLRMPMIQDVGSEYIGKLLTLDCLVVKRAEITPKASLGVFKCGFCNTVIKIKLDREPVPELCPQCKRRSLKQVNNESEFINLQRIAVQDPLEKLKGSTPTWQLEVWLEDDMVNTVIPGDRVDITGILRIRPRKTFKGKQEDKALFTMFFDSISIQQKQKEFTELEINTDEEKEIKEMARDPRIFEKIAKSIAPSIYGYDQIKPALLSRFDLIFPITDVLDEEKDKQIAEHILVQHSAAGAQISQIEGYKQVEAPPIDQTLLRKYVAYARKNVRPRLMPEASKRIEEYYIELRKIGMRQGATPITPRQIEGLVRLAEASAKSRLSQQIEVRDSELGIALFEHMLNTLAVDRGGRRDIDILTTGMSREKVNRITSLIDIIKKIEQEEDGAKIVRVLEEAEKAGMDGATAKKYIDELERIGDIFSPKPGILRIVRRGEE